MIETPHSQPNRVFIDYVFDPHLVLTHTVQMTLPHSISQPQSMLDSAKRADSFLFECDSVHFHSYSGDIFNAIPDYWDVKHQSKWVEENAKEFGDLICNHGLHDVFGIALLHRHFPLKPHEKLIRHYTNSRFSLSCGRINHTDHVLPYMWRIISSENGSTNFYPLEFCDVGPEYESIANAQWEHAKRRSAFFQEFADLATALEATDKVALVSLYQKDIFDISPGESLFEETYERSRYITLHVGDNIPDDQYPDDSVKTSWWFSPSQAHIDSSVCLSHCYAHCRHDPEDQLKRK